MSSNDRYKHFEETAASSSISAVRPLIELLKAKDAEDAINTLAAKFVDPES